MYFCTNMNLVNEIIELLKKELLLEWRQRSAISGIFLYVFSTIFVIFSTFITVQGKTWNALFWIVILFASVNAVAKSFLQENNARQLYYYTLANPIAIILSKMIYNTILLFIIGLMAFGTFGLLVGNPVKDVGLFLTTLLLSSAGLSITFTFISAISIKANNSATLMVILSFPVVLPIIMTLLKLSANSLRLIQDTGYRDDLIILIAIDAILISVAVILFPFLWKD